MKQPASDSQGLQPDFDRVARIYRWAEYLALGPLLLRARRFFLPRLRGVRHALVLGDGDGRFLASLFRQNPRLRATAVDLSASMLRLLHRRCVAAHAERAPSLQTLHASALEVRLPPSTELIVTHFLLDCFTQPEADRLVQRFASTAQPGTLWLVSEFGIPPGRIAGTLARLYIRALYAGFRVLTGLRVTHLPDVAAALRAGGLRRLHRRQWLRGFLYTELWQVHSGQEAFPVTPELQDPPEYDALPNPEPPVPSLGAPDPAVFHPAPPAPDEAISKDSAAE